MEKKLRAFVELARKDNDIAGAILFGSRAKGTETKASDTDICIFVRRTFKGRMTKKRLQYMEEGLDVHIFQQLPVYMKARVLKEGKTLFISDKNDMYDAAFDAIKEFEYFKPRYDMIIEGVVRG